MQGSVYITRECCGSSEIELGTVYAAEMGITLFSSIDRYTLDEAEIKIYYHLTLVKKIRMSMKRSKNQLLINWRAIKKRKNWEVSFDIYRLFQCMDVIHRTEKNGKRNLNQH